ncbi:response regulator [bacterium]|nr:response regulator [bacterium]
MRPPLRVLIVEDSPDDDFLILRELQKNGRKVEHQRVENLSQMKKALDEKKWDVVIADYVLPQFSGLGALKHIKNRGSDLPLIMVSGKIGEDTAADSIKKGAYDFVMKDHLFKLTPAVERALEEVESLKKRKKAEQEQARLAAALEQAMEGVLVVNCRRVIQYVNPSVERIIGIQGKEIKGKKLDVLGFTKKNPQKFQDMKKAIQKDESWNGRIDHKIEGNQELKIDISLSPILRKEKSTQQNEYVIILRDVTEEWKFQEKLQQRQKLEALGTLAGGVAHDLNNILMPIIVNTELVQSYLSGESPVRDYLDQIQEAAKRGKGLVKQIVSFSRQKIQEFKPLRLDTVLKEGIKLVQSSLPSHIKIKRNIHSPCFVKADPTQIHQVVVNLCGNAADAMKEKSGTIRVSLQEMKLNPGETASHLGLEPGNYVNLRVSDSGPGMDQKTLKQAFDPFFTTKNGKGTGMGLAVVHGIVKSHHGTITVQSRKGKGTTFDVYLPSISLGEEEEINEEDLHSLPGGEERILLVDDDETLLYSVHRVLEKLGYSVNSHKNSRKALNEFCSSPYDYDLILVDQVMPQLSGMDFSRKAMGVREDIPIILITGYSEEIQKEEVKAQGIDEFLMKPLYSGEMAEVLRRVLDSKGT